MNKIVVILALAVLLAASSRAQEDSLQGATYRANIQRTGVHQTTGLKAASGIKWTVQTGGPVRSSPVAVDGTVYVGSGDGLIYAIDADSGDKRWTLDTGGAVNGSATVHKGTLYMASQSGHFYAIDCSTGDIRWQHTEPRSASASSFAVLEGVAYVGAAGSGMEKISMGGGKLLALDTDSGKKLWDAWGPQGIGAPACTGNITFVNGGGGVYYHILDLSKEGKAIGSGLKGGHQARQLNSAAIANGFAYCPFSMEGSIICCDLKGKEQWKTATHPQNLEMNMNSGGMFECSCFTDLAVTRELVFIGCQTGSLYAFDARTGEKRWTHDSAGPILTSSPSVAGGLVYYGSNDGTLYAVDMNGKEVWKQELGGAINSSPWPGDGVIYVGCDDGGIFAIE